MATLNEILLTENHAPSEYTATYSAEDNKLRLYAPRRFSAELYEYVKAHGFKWAPKQELFVKPRWTPQAEDFLKVMAGDIQAEEMTLAERAEFRAARFDGYRENRLRDANHFQRSAAHYAERFAQGQPILMGHHSQRSAQTAQKRMESAENNATRQLDTADYWAYRAQGVELHAEYKNNPRTRHNRIKTLLKELRDHQRAVNHQHHAVKTWELTLTKDEETQRKRTEYFVAAYSSDGRYSPNGTYNELRSNKITWQEALTRSHNWCKARLESPHNTRWMQHILNRIGYETALLGPIPRYTDALTPVILQAFARTHGAEKPKATKTDNGFTLTSPVPLPAHIAESAELTLNDAEWRLLMQDCGYHVEASKPRAPRKTKQNTTPALNLDVPEHQTDHCWNGSKITYPVKRMTKAEYSATFKDDRRMHIATGGHYKFKTVFSRGEDNKFKWFAVYLTDSKTHPVPDAPTPTE